jgi:hypothetical protein
MNKFKTRLKYFLIGFSLGLVFIFFIFGNRACAWLPENRVKNMLAEKEILVGDSVKFLMDCQKVTNDDVYRLLNEEGDVDFQRSITDTDPKIYLFQGKKDKKDITITYALGDSTTEVIGFEFKLFNCISNLSNEHKNVVSVPEFEIISLIEEQEIRILDKAACQFEAYGLKKTDVLTFHTHATNIIEKSEPRLKPNPSYWLKGKIGLDEYEIKYIIGDSRTRIAEINGPIEKDCD